MKLISILFSIVLLCMVSCRTTKKIVDANEVDADNSQLVSAYEENKLVFDEVEFEANTTYEGNMSLSFSSIFRIKHDKKIWASMKKFGFEAARILITPDSLFVLNRFQKTYVAEDIGKLQKMTGVPLVFDDLQQMLIGGSFWTSNLIAKNDSTLFKVETIKGDVVEATHVFDARQLVRKSDIKSAKQGMLAIEYENYKAVEGKSLAFDRRFMVNKGEMNVLLDIQTETFEYNTSNTFPFEIPANYTRQSF